jgi:hypothetical protein
MARASSGRTYTMGVERTLSLIWIESTARFGLALLDWGATSSDRQWALG